MEKDDSQQRDSTIKTTKRILIVDDHPLIRTGLAALIGQEPDLQLCAECGSMKDALELAKTAKPDLAIVDLSLADGSGLELVQRLHCRDPQLHILVCSIHDEMLFAQRALHAGASGYINKSEATDHIIEAVRRVLNDGIWLSEAMTERVLRAAAMESPATSVVGIENLTDRELGVFRLIGEGLGPTSIAGRLHLSVKTIETHREKIKRKLRLKSGHELTRSAVQWVLEQN